jgi:hypothetical protein
MKIDPEEICDFINIWGRRLALTIFIICGVSIVVSFSAAFVLTVFNYISKM